MNSPFLLLPLLDSSTLQCPHIRYFHFLIHGYVGNYHHQGNWRFEPCRGGGIVWWRNWTKCEINNQPRGKRERERGGNAKVGRMRESHAPMGRGAFVASLHSRPSLSPSVVPLGPVERRPLSATYLTRQISFHPWGTLKLTLKLHNECEDIEVVESRSNCSLHIFFWLQGHR